MAWCTTKPWSLLVVLALTALLSTSECSQSLKHTSGRLLRSFSAIAATQKRQALETKGTALKTEFAPTHTTFAPSAWFLGDDCTWRGLACDASGTLPNGLRVDAPGCATGPAPTSVPPELAAISARFLATSERITLLSILEPLERPQKLFSCPTMPTPVEQLEVAPAAMVQFTFQTSVCVDQPDLDLVEAAMLSTQLVSQTLGFPAASVKVVSLQCEQQQQQQVVDAAPVLALRLVFVKADAASAQPSGSNAAASQISAPEMAEVAMAEGLALGTALSDFLWVELVQDMDYGFVTPISASNAGRGMAVFAKADAVVATRH